MFHKQGCLSNSKWCVHICNPQTVPRLLSSSSSTWEIADGGKYNDEYVELEPRTVHVIARSNVLIF